MRLNRKRFWGGEMNEDKLSAYQTLYTCLETVALLMAPIAPFFSDRLFTDLTTATGRADKSVHLCNFPTLHEEIIDKELEERMHIAQDITLSGHHAARSLQAQIFPDILNLFFCNISLSQEYYPCMNSRRYPYISVHT